jgi:hypothetical protein
MRRFVRKARYKSAVERAAMLLLMLGHLADCCVWFLSLSFLTSSFASEVCFSEWYEKLCDK